MLEQFAAFFGDILKQTYFQYGVVTFDIMT